MSTGGAWEADCDGLHTYGQAAIWHSGTREIRVLAEMPAGSGTELWNAAERLAKAWADHLNQQEDAEP